MKIGCYVPEQIASVLYSMAGDDCSLHHELDKLTPKQQVDHAENQMLTCALQVALVGLGKSIDYVSMAKQFDNKEWSSLLSHYLQMFKRIGLESVGSENIFYHPLDNFYNSVSRSLPEVDLVNLYMISGSNSVLHQNSNALEISRNTNSKLHFSYHAPSAGIPVPVTKVFRKRGIQEGEADDFFSKNPKGLMVKLLGLAGARNVFPAATVKECLESITEYDNDLEVLLQEIIDTDRFKEMTVDLTITPRDISISNVRKILFAGGKWVGNYIASELVVTDRHYEELMKVGEYARSHGHVSEEGVNCGVDYFIDGDEVIVTEINARWTGGLFPAEFLRKLYAKKPAIAFFDMVPIDQIPLLQSFQSDHLYTADEKNSFGYIPMGFCPFNVDIDGRSNAFFWQIVTGDFESFVSARKKTLPDGAFPTADLILAEAL